MSTSSNRHLGKRDILKWVLPLISVSLTLLLALAIIRWLAPQWLGLPVNLQMVQIDKAVPPFFDNVFRSTDYTTTDFLIPDPILKRARPLYPDLLETGPHDILGFRNRAVPHCADIVIIGDSQTYGNNASLDDNWPSRLTAQLPKETVSYNMAVGGWGAIEYLEAFPKACHFLPRVVIIAFYTGNDALESFTMAYSQERWVSLRPDPSLKAADGPAVPFPTPRSAWLTITFRNGQSITFTPSLRLVANQSHPAVDAGYAIMSAAARRLSSLSEGIGVQLVFTIIPTKEMVYAKRIREEGIPMPPAFSQLVQAESDRISKLSAELKQIKDARFIDLVEPLQTAAITRQDLYPSNENGHPLSEGYRIIGETVGKAVQGLLPPPPQGVFLAQIGHGRTAYVLVRNNRRWLFASEEILRANKWRPESIKRIPPRDIANIPFGGIIQAANPKTFGPSKP